MMREVYAKIIRITIILFSAGLFFLSGCSVGTSPDDPVDNEIHYTAGASIAALPYHAFQPVNFYIKEASGKAFKKLLNGDYVGKGVRTIGISVPPRTMNEGALSQRVFVSDGGYDDHVEALLDEAQGFYVCDFYFGGKFLTQPLLVQVIYPDGSALKEKIVVITENGQRPPSGLLIKNGMGITVGKDLLAGFDTLLENMLSRMLKMTVHVDSFEPADNHQGASKGVFHLNLKNLLDSDLILNDQRGKVRGLNIEFEDLSIMGDNSLGQFMGTMLNPILQFSLGSIGFDLGEMLSGLGGDEAKEEDIMASILGNLELDKMLFVNVFGDPDFSTPEVAALGGGLFAYGKAEVLLDEDGKYIWPEVQIDDSQEPIDLTVITKNPDYNLGLALSQYNLNQILPDIMQGLKIVIDAKSLDLPFVTPEKSDDPMEIHVTVNPAGIAIDLSDKEGDAHALLALNDVRLEFVEASTPMAELSADVTLTLLPEIRYDEKGFFLNLSFKPVESLCHVHVMKDNKGLGLFDHARLIKTLFNSLSGGEGDGSLVIPLNLADFGLTPIPDEVPGGIEFDGKGNCFMGLALEAVDPSALLGEDACFIRTAGLF